MKKRFGSNLLISWQACILGALMLLVLPLNLLISAFCAALIHELCHVTVLHLFHVQIHSIRVGIGGAAIVTGPLPPVQELLCACAGPIGSFLCLTAAECSPLLALCGLLQGAYNLLPLYPMDGGRILRCLAILCLPNHADRLCGVFAFAARTAILGCGILLGIRMRNVFFPIIGLSIFARSVPKRNRPCKSACF